jgi:hypothetical protein
MFDKLPPSGFGDECLKPLGRLLRFLTSSVGESNEPTLREVRDVEDAERELVDFMRKWGSFIDYMRVDDAREVWEPIGRVQRRVQRAKASIALRLDGGDA